MGFPEIFGPFTEGLIFALVFLVFAGDFCELPCCEQTAGVGCCTRVETLLVLRVVVFCLSSDTGTSLSVVGVAAGWSTPSSSSEETVTFGLLARSSPITQ